MKTTEARETQDNSNGSHQLPDRRTNEPKWNDAATVVSSRAQQTRLRQRADAASAVSLARSRAPDSARLPPAQGPAPSLAESAASGDAAEPVGRGGAGLPASASCCSSCSSRGGADSDSASRWLPLYRDKDWDWPAALAPHLARYEALVPAPPSRVGKTSRSGGVIGRRVMERVFLCRTASGREARFMLAAMPEMSLLTLMLTIRRHIVRYHKKLRETSPGTSGDSDADANADGDSDNGDGDDEDEEDGENGGEPFDSYSTSSESDEINDTMDVGADEGHVVGASMLLASFARRARNCPALWLDLEHPIREGLQAAAMHMLNWMGKESVVHQNYVAGHLAKFLVFTIFKYQNTVPQPSNLLTLMEESILLRIPDVRKFIERSTPLLGITLIQNSAVHDADIISSSCASLTSSRQAHARQEKWGIIAKQERFGSISAELSSVLIPALMKHTTTCTIYKCLTVGCICTLLKRTNPTTYTSSQRNEIYECVVSSLQAGSQSVTLPAAVCVLANTILIPTPEQETLLVDVILKTINDGKRVVHIDAQHFTKLFSLLKIPENIKKHWRSFLVCLEVIFLLWVFSCYAHFSPAQLKQYLIQRLQKPPPIYLFFSKKTKDPLSLS
ncbi:hypothetical protein Pelo_10449 [Pelomyxa schiedti]|nr:hypothetical protein Pelo_10449 [Pelomyxa schiedti]